LALQESYDNSGLILGEMGAEVSKALLCLDSTEAVVEEAIAKGCDLIIAHHPIIFSGLKKLTGSNYVERTIIKAIKNDVAIYACHTSLDNVSDGVNQKIGKKLGLGDLKILSPKSGLLKKLVTYVPASHHQLLLSALFDAGAGHIGNYDQCSFNSEGTGTFRGNESSQPFIGKPNELNRESEIKIETIFKIHEEQQVLEALQRVHPYEEVAYDIYSLQNKSPFIGSGMVGELAETMEELKFLEHVKKTFIVPVIKHTALSGKLIKRVAICGGSGSFLLKQAIARQADAFITADFKYHEYFDVENKLLLVDAGHYETEQFTSEIFYELIKKKFTTFAIHLSKINTNPINYF
jgi:dinuclear metal center YbgI/SA1388 family protein